MVRIQFRDSLLLLLVILCSHVSMGQHYFVPNEGQWGNDYAFKTQFGNTTFTIGSDHFGFIQTSYEDEPEGGHSHGHFAGGHFYKMNFVGAQAPSFESVGEAPYYENYFIGDRKYWRDGIQPVEEVYMRQLYPNVDVRVYTQYGQLKYDLLAPSADDIQQVAIYYDGVESVEVKDGRLHVTTSIGENVEIRPYVYHPDSKRAIEASYVLSGDTLRFQIDEDYHGPVVVDPTFIFSTYTGSSKDNWGYSATFDPSDSSVYVAGIVRQAAGNYPTTPGAFDSTYNGGPDVSISKFSSDGTTLLYSTYLGAAQPDQPTSIIADDQGRLVIIGSTGSADFPVDSMGYDTSFGGGNSVTSGSFTFGAGCDLFVTVMNPDGRSLYGSTFMGGAATDGINQGLINNYGDKVRGEVILSPWNTILIATSSSSLDLPLVNSFSTGNAGKQDAWVIELSLDCRQLLWSTTFGNAELESGFSIRVNETTGDIVLAGSTESGALPLASNGAATSSHGMRDGYITIFDSATRAPFATTFTGTASDDMNFLIDLDEQDNVYVLGQTEDGSYPTSPNAISEINPSVFVHQFSPDLSVSMRSLAFGNKQFGSMSISPTAFLVDKCGDVYISGWGGVVGNSTSNTRNMHITKDAFQSTTDGSDLYFAVIDASFRKFNYATYFGANGVEEHVDGGTSRFDNNGVMYQAICAGCGGFDTYPTFPNNVYSRNNGSGNCNLAVTVIAFEQQDATVNVSAPDTVCSPFNLVIYDTITGADIVIWDMGNGDIDTSLTVPQRQYNTPGTYTIQVIALDTNCNTSDTAEISFTVVSATVDANVGVSYDPCDPSRTVNFITPNNNGSAYYWDFGDGTKDTTFGNTSHTYITIGQYTVTVIAQASNCFGSAIDTMTTTIGFYNAPNDPRISFLYDGCNNQGEARFSTQTPNWHIFEWEFDDGRRYNGNSIVVDVEPGFITVTLTVTDTFCNRTVTVSETFEARPLSYAFGGLVPNAFSPDGDGQNDFFQLQEGFTAPTNIGFKIKVYDRWGQLLFESGTADFKWDGTVDGKPLTEGVYFWIVEASSDCGAGAEENGVVHIMKTPE